MCTLSSLTSGVAWVACISYGTRGAQHTNSACLSVCARRTLDTCAPWYPCETLHPVITCSAYLPFGACNSICSDRALNTCGPYDARGALGACVATRSYRTFLAPGP